MTENGSRPHLRDCVARALYEARATRRSSGWDDTLEVIQEEYLALADEALRATARWLRDAAPVFIKRPQLQAALLNVSGLIRRCIPAREEEAA